MAEHRSTRTDKGASPRSWDRSTWPADVWPNDSERAQWVLRSYRNQLVEHGALTRVGKRLVVLERGYQRFLEKQMANVIGFEGNNPEISRAA